MRDRNIPRNPLPRAVGRVARLALLPRAVGRVARLARDESPQWSQHSNSAHGNLCINLFMPWKKNPFIDVFYHQSSEQHPGQTAGALPLSRKGRVRSGDQTTASPRPYRMSAFVYYQMSRTSTGDLGPANPGQLQPDLFGWQQRGFAGKKKPGFHPGGIRRLQSLVGW